MNELQKLRTLIREFIKQSPEFDGDIELAKRIAIALCEVEEKLRDLER